MSRDTTFHIVTVMVAKQLLSEFCRLSRYIRDINPLKVRLIRSCHKSAKNCHENANVFSTKAQM